MWGGISIRNLNLGEKNRNDKIPEVKGQKIVLTLTSIYLGIGNRANINKLEL